MMNRFGGHGWGMGLAWLAGLILIVLIVWLINTIINRNKNHFENIGTSAIEILKERYAKGEISKEEFEEKKREIS